MGVNLTITMRCFELLFVADGVLTVATTKMESPMSELAKFNMSAANLSSDGFCGPTKICLRLKVASAHAMTQGKSAGRDLVESSLGM